MKQHSIKIAYFSGTGCTAYAADIFKQTAETIGLNADLYRIGSDDEFIFSDKDILILCYVVHACNPPKPVISWLKSLEQFNTRAAVISVSGGGEVTPNLASRLTAVKILKNKGFDVSFEDMLVMPSNWVIPTPERLASRLIEVLPLKAEKILSDILSGKRQRTNPGIGNRILSVVCRLEHFGAGKVGRKMKVSEHCTGCGQCSRKCPVGNIKIKDGLPVFSSVCTLCLNCIYTCPEKAVSLPVLKFFKIKEGFSLNRILELKRPVENFDVYSETDKTVWQGVREYLSDFE